MVNKGYRFLRIKDMSFWIFWQEIQRMLELRERENKVGSGLDKVLYQIKALKYLMILYMD